MRAPFALPIFLLSACTPVPDGPAPAYDVVINEFQASNVTTIPDEAGGFDDWIELFNAGEEAADLTDHYLTDDLLNPTRWRIPADTTIEPRGFLLVWADGAADGPLHANFSLSAAGEAIGLFGPLTYEAVQIDAVQFELQAADESMARRPDGASSWQADSTPTPEASNE